MHQGLGRGRSLIGSCLNGVQEKAQPLLPIAGQTDRLQQLVISLAMLLEIEAQIQKRLAQGSFGAKKQGDQQPAETPIAIQEWMDRFKLDVSQSRLDEERRSNGV